MQVQINPKLLRLRILKQNFANLNVFHSQPSGRKTTSVWWTTSAGEFDANNAIFNRRISVCRTLVNVSWILLFLVYAAGIISLLSEPDVDILQQLNAIVDQFCPEISEAILKM